MIRSRPSSSSQSWLPAQRLDGGVLELSDGSLRAILECPTLAFGLRGESEQRAVMHAWAGLLNSLPHPLQFLIQTRSLHPADLASALQQDADEGTPHARLRSSYAQLLGTMSSSRRMVARRFYVVVPWDPLTITHLFSRRRQHLGRDNAVEMLEQRVRWVSEWLRRIDLEPIRLTGRSLAGVLYETLCPDTARVQQLPEGDSFEDLPSLIAPAAVEERAGEVRLGRRRARSLAVSHYPKRLIPGWLDSLHAFEGDLDVSLHLQPAPNQAVMPFLERRIAELSSTVRLTEERGRRADPYRRAALEDAEELQDRIARGEERLIEAGLYLTVWADRDEGLEGACQRIEALLGSQLIHSRRLLFQMEPGLITTLPVGVDRVGLRRSLSTSALAATFPFTGNDLSQGCGLLYGINPEVRSPVLLDRFRLENHNAVVFATSGAGKSFLVKVELLRAFLDGIRVHVIDPEGEYAPIVEALGGSVLSMHPGSPVSLDAFAVTDGEAGALSSRIAALHTLFGLLAGGLSPVQRAAVEDALTFTYAAQGFTDDGDTGGLVPPTLRDVDAALERKAGATTGGTRSEIEELRLKLSRYLSGSGRWLFAPSVQRLATGPLAAYVLAGLPEEERAPAMFLVLDRVWSQLGRGGDRTLLVVDEAWWLMQYPDTARALLRIAKTARKRKTGLTVVTQDVPDVLASDFGEPIVTNAAVQVLMRQASQAMPRLAKLCNLTETEQAWLLNARPGEGLLLAQGKRVPFFLTASEEEARLIKQGEGRGRTA
jgi:TraG P-loop domain/Helicase HerA, central domain